MESKADLFQIVLALDAIGSFPNLLHGRQKQPNEYADNRNHHEQFDERKRLRSPRPTAMMAVHFFYSVKWRKRRRRLSWPQNAPLDASRALYARPIRSNTAHEPVPFETGKRTGEAIQRDHFCLLLAQHETPGATGGRSVMMLSSYLAYVASRTVR
jgi:hypothetical protein